MLRWTNYKKLKIIYINCMMGNWGGKLLAGNGNLQWKKQGSVRSLNKRISACLFYQFWLHKYFTPKYPHVHYWARSLRDEEVHTGKDEKIKDVSQSTLDFLTIKFHTEDSFNSGKKECWSLWLFPVLLESFAESSCLRSVVNCSTFVFL